VTSPCLVEELIPRNNALSVLLHRVQYLLFVGRYGNQATAFSSQLYVAQIHIPIIESKGVPHRRTRGSTHRGLALTPRRRGTMKLQDDCNGRSVAKQLKACGLIQLTRDIVSVRLEKSLHRSLGRSILCDHQNSRQDVHPWDRNQRTRHVTQPPISSQVRYRDHRALFLGTLPESLLTGDRF
jgi:hypothetical protein